MLRVLICLALAIVCQLGSGKKLDCSEYTSPSTSTYLGERRCHNSGDLIFEDEFDELDFDVWDHEITMAGGGNWEFQFYGCMRVGSGNNILNPIASARLRTANKFGVTYGRFEARAQLPAGDWIWPAIWLLPLREAYGLWPSSGEIDIMESRGNRGLTLDGVNIGVEQYGATLQYGLDVQTNEWARAHWVKNNPDGFDKDFHLYQCEWTPDYMAFFIDDEEIGRVTYPEGGMWEHGEATNANGKPWMNTSPQASFDFWQAKSSWYPTWNPEENNGEDAAMKIDYIKVWAV